jgi:hypothetical protein
MRRIIKVNRGEPRPIGSGQPFRSIAGCRGIRRTWKNLFLSEKVELSAQSKNHNRNNQFD